MVDEGYLIVERPTVVIARYNQSSVATKNASALHNLRQALDRFCISKYRGTSRHFMIPLPPQEADIEKFRASGIDVASNGTARRRFGQIVKQSSLLRMQGDEGDDLDISLAEAKEIASLADSPENWEVIHVSRADLTRTANTLGFDVGYWDGDWFSLIADTIVTPTWHPPAPSDFAELGNALAELNENLLFGSPKAAGEYRCWYKSRPWAEIEDYEGQFCIIRVNKTQ